MTGSLLIRKRSSKSEGLISRSLNLFVFKLYHKNASTLQRKWKISLRFVFQVFRFVIGMLSITGKQDNDQCYEEGTFHFPSSFFSSTGTGSAMNWWKEWIFHSPSFSIHSVVTDHGRGLYTMPSLLVLLIMDVEVTVTNRGDSTNILVSGMPKSWFFIFQLARKLSTMSWKVAYRVPPSI